MPKATSSRGRLAVLLAAWGLAVVVGMLALTAYARRPGAAGAPAARWPAGTSLKLDDRRPTLLIFLHPLCPCSQASLEELAVLADRQGDRVAMTAVVYRPRGDRDGWSPAELGSSLAAVRLLEVRPDAGGEEARRFAVATSGHVLLYRPGGELVFSGGITAARGMQGENLGRSAVAARIAGNGEGEPIRGIPVFGCPLLPAPGPGQG